MLQMRLLRRVQSSLLRRIKKRTAVVTGAANDESMLFRPPTTMIMQLPPLSGVPSYTDEHANPRNFTVAKLLHALEYTSAAATCPCEEEAAHRYQHDCEMMRMAAPLFSLLRSNLSALRRSLSWLEMPYKHVCKVWRGQAHESLLMLSNTHAKSTVGLIYNMQALEVLGLSCRMTRIATDLVPLLLFAWLP